MHSMILFRFSCVLQFACFAYSMCLCATDVSTLDALFIHTWLFFVFVPTFFLFLSLSTANLVHFLWCMHSLMLCNFIAQSAFSHIESNHVDQIKLNTFRNHSLQSIFLLHFTFGMHTKMKRIAYELMRERTKYNWVPNRNKKKKKKRKNRSTRLFQWSFTRKCMAFECNFHHWK